MGSLRRTGLLLPVVSAPRKGGCHLLSAFLWTGTAVLGSRGPGLAARAFGCDGRGVADGSRRMGRGRSTGNGRARGCRRRTGTGAETRSARRADGDGPAGEALGRGPDPAGAGAGWRWGGARPRRSRTGPGSPGWRRRGVDSGASVAAAPARLVRGWRRLGGQRAASTSVRVLLLLPRRAAARERWSSRRARRPRASPRTPRRSRRAPSPHAGTSCCGDRSRRRRPDRRRAGGGVDG